MKNILSLALLFSTAVQAQNGFTITGNITDMPAKSTVSLTNMQDPTDTLAKTTVTNGKFVLKGSVKEPALYFFNFAQPGKKSLIFLDNSQVSMTGSVNDVKKITIKGSKSNADYQVFETTFNPLILKYNAISQKAQASGMDDATAKNLEAANKDIQKAIDDFTDARKDSYVSPFLLLVTYQLSDMNVLESRFNKLTPPIQNSIFGNYLKEKVIDVAKIGAVGTDAIEFTQNDTTGAPVSLSSFRGKYVLVDFWASWCGPCRQENPNVVANYEKFKDKNFTVLGVSLDKSRDSWIKAIKDDKLVWTHVSDLKFWQNEVAAKYHIEQIPQNFLVGPDGKIVARNLRGGVLQATLCQLLGCK
jgi:peroxiredoxin